MKRLVVIPGFIFLCFSSLSFAQFEKSEYLKLDYIKVEPAKTQEFVEYMLATWKPVYEQQVQSGDINSWRLYQVRFPGGEKNIYNFVVISAGSDLGKFEDSRPARILATIESERQNRRIIQKTNSLRQIMFSELWKVVNQVENAKPSPQSGKYMMMDYMKVVPGREFDYQMLEDEIAKPIHRERINNGNMAGWEMYDLITPGGIEYGYNFATGNFFDHLENLEFGFTEKVINTALPGTDIPELFGTIYKTRDLVQSQLWERVAGTERMNTDIQKSE